MRLLIALLIASPLCFAQSSEVVVRSNPSDAEVSINGTVVGRTPLTVPMHGIHLPFNLAVNKNGFDSWYVQTVSEPGKSVINAELQSSGFTLERAETEFQHPRQAEALTGHEVSKAKPIPAVESTNSTATRQNDTAFKQVRE
jgi:PEGA domain